MMMALFRRFRSDRAGVTAVIFAAALPPMMLLVALAIDFGGAVAAKTKLDLAADAAAMAAATTASQMYIAAPGSTLAQIQAAAVSAGQKRFAAEFGSVGNLTMAVQPAIVITQTGETFSAALSFPETAYPLYTPYFATLAGVAAIPLTVVSGMSVTLTAPYLNVEILLDNSGSMEIAATPADIEKMQAITACSLTNAYYCTKTTTTGSGNQKTTICDPQKGWVQSNGLSKSDAYFNSSYSDQNYGAYGCSAGGYTYRGPLACPIVADTIDGVSYPAFPVGAAPNCPFSLVVPKPPQGTAANYIHNGFQPVAGPPCAFACHFDTSSAPGLGTDSYALARANGVTLRFDLVKSAVNQVITTMKADDLPIHNLRVGVFWFADIIKQVYPNPSTKGAEAGNDWAAALSAVGGPVKGGADTGIPPYVGGNGGNTDFPAIMSQLAGTSPIAAKSVLAGALTQAYIGESAAQPRKALFIVTDGLQDPASRAIAAFDPASCNTFKNMGYGIYVLYTPYYDLMNPYYLGQSPTARVVQAASTDPSSIPYNLKQCASTPANYLEASDSNSIAAALKTFLKQALASRARITK